MRVAKYTQEQLDKMTAAEICEIAIELDIIHLDDLVEDILTLSE